jgi:hypothetical protein
MNITWKIVSLKAFPLLDGKANVISLVAYNVSAEENGIRVAHGGFLSLPTDNIETFIPYEDLSEEEILGWVKYHLGTTGVESSEREVASKLQSNPPQVAVPVDLPW